jgi:hypothetical protein
MNPFLHPLRVAVFGSPRFEAIERIDDYVLRLHPGCSVLVGGPLGRVERAAATIAAARGLDVDLRRAAHRRLVERSEYVVAFWDGVAPAARRALDYASGLGRPSELVLAGPVETIGPRLEIRLELGR